MLSLLKDECRRHILEGMNIVKIWKVRINYETGVLEGHYWGVAKDYQSAAEKALLQARKNNEVETGKGLWVDEIICYGEKMF